MDEVVEPIPLEMRKRVQMIAALDVLNKACASEIVRMADDMLNQCIYDDLLVAIIDSNPKDQFAVHKYLERYCNKIGIAYPPEYAARLIVLDHYLRRIVETNSNPDAEVVELAIKKIELNEQFEELSNLLMIWHYSLVETPTDDSLAIQKERFQMMRIEAAKLLARPDFQEVLAASLKV